MGPLTTALTSIVQNTTKLQARVQMATSKYKNAENWCCNCKPQLISDLLLISLLAGCLRSSCNTNLIQKCFPPRSLTDMWFVT